MYVRVKKIGSKRYAYLVEGVSKKGKVRQKTLAYLGPRTMRVGPYTARIVGVEELILDRLSAAKLLNIPADYEKAKVLYDNFKKQIDMEYLRKTAKGKNVGDSLLRITETPSPKLGR